MAGILCQSPLDRTLGEGCGSNNPLPGPLERPLEALTLGEGCGGRSEAAGEREAPDLSWCGVREIEGFLDAEEVESLLRKLGGDPGDLEEGKTKLSVARSLLARVRGAAISAGGAPQPQQDYGWEMVVVPAKVSVGCVHTHRDMWDDDSSIDGVCSAVCYLYDSVGTAKLVIAPDPLQPGDGGLSLGCAERSIDIVAGKLVCWRNDLCKHRVDAPPLSRRVMLGPFACHPSTEHMFSTEACYGYGRQYRPKQWPRPLVPRRAIPKRFFTPRPYEDGPESEEEGEEDEGEGEDEEDKDEEDKDEDKEESEEEGEGAGSSSTSAAASTSRRSAGLSTHDVEGDDAASDTARKRKAVDTSPAADGGEGLEERLRASESLVQELVGEAERLRGRIAELERELANHRPDSIDLTGEGEAEVEPAGGGGRGMRLIAEQQVRLVEVKRERDEMEEEKDEEGNYSTVFIGRLQDKIDALKTLLKDRGVDQVDIDKALSG